MIYFGCWADLGHRVYDLHGHSLRDDYCKRHGWPMARDLDASSLLLPHPEKVGAGAITYLSAPDLTVLAWWGSAWDARPKSNTMLIARGTHTAAELWKLFSVRFPEIAPHYDMPITIVGDARTL